MSMFDIVRNNKRITQVFLAVITLPFAFWGVESYVRNVDSGNELATVGTAKISQQELQASIREQQEKLRSQLGGKLDPVLFDSPDMRRAVLDSLITQRLLAEQARKAKMSVGDAQLAQFIASVPSLQENGKFSKERYEALVANQGMSKEMFEARLRQDLAMQQLALPVSEAGIYGVAATGRWMTTQLEQRDVSEAALFPDAYAKQVKLSADAVQKYYDANRKQFETPEQVRVEFVMLSRDALANQAAPSDDEIKAAYKANEARYKAPETRRASHILLRLDKSASDADAKAVKEKAEGILAQVKKTPGDFAKLAKQYSQDPGSAEKGGDLDWFGRGAMVKAFEDSVFAMKDGQISELVRSDFGFHIIRVSGVRGERIKPLEEVRVEIAAELKAAAGTKKYSEAAEGFGNMVYEQSDSLKPAADKWKLEIKQSPWLAKGAKLPPPFDNPKLAGAVFADDAVKNKRNTEAVEVSPGMLVSARVAEHKPAAVQPLESVKSDVEKLLVRDEAAALAIKDGEAKLVRLQKGEAVELKWSPTQAIRRSEPRGLAPESVRAIFAADVAKLPVYVGTAHPGKGYALYRIAGVKAVANAKDDPRAASLQEMYARAVAEEEFAAWLSSLRESHPVKVNKALLEAKER
jgi:peptidyl-prolyl cis-trans isomerase D